MPDEPISTSIQTKYAEQLAADLATNQSAQATLIGRLNLLKEEEKWLATTLDSLPSSAGESADEGVAADAGTEDVSVPQPRARETTDTAALKQAPTKKTTAVKRPAKAAPAKKAPAVVEDAEVEKAPVAKKAAAARTAAQKPVVRKTTAAAKKAVKPTGPTLGELLKELLARQPGEPKKVSEISAELKTAHPERATSDQTVRNTLERLVKDGLEKDTRQGLVLYTWPTAETPAPAAVAERAKDEEPAEADLAGV
ncbi:hypothetical protein ABZ567_20885 [Streptomyces sp. NPDC016459]|uniref:hypothetical protein n=1 Tax=Streptomyces sp. NPDC016459 TaxID=3157190 RepID=UPI0033F0EA45